MRYPIKNKFWGWLLGLKEKPAPIDTGPTATFSTFNQSYIKATLVRENNRAPNKMQLKI